MESHPTYTILLIDDDAFLLNMYSLKFSKSNFQVVTAQSGTEALGKLKDGLTPDIMMLDIIMPGMDGLQFLEEVRKQKLIDKTTIIMLTNQSDTTDIERAQKLKVDGYIVKAMTIPSEVIAQVISIHSKKITS